MLRTKFFLHFLFVGLLGALFHADLFAVNYGRWGIVDRYDETLIISGATNNIRRLARFNGLTFQDSATASDFTSLLPVKGDVNLNGGTLSLGRDLRFEDVVDFIGTGKIYGDSESHSISFPGNLKSWSYSYTFQDVAMTFNSDLELSSEFTFQNTCTVDCHGCQLDLRPGGSLYVASGADLTLKNAHLVGMKDDNLLCLSGSSRVRLVNSSLLLSGNYTINQGIIDVYLENKITGTGQFSYQSAQDLTIRSKSKLFIDRNITFSYDSSAAAKDKLVFEDSSSILHLNGCTVHSTHTGLELTGGRVIIEDKVAFQNEAVNRAEATVFKEPLEVDVLSGGILDLTDGIFEHE